MAGPKSRSGLTATAGSSRLCRGLKAQGAGTGSRRRERLNCSESPTRSATGSKLKRNDPGNDAGLSSTLGPDARTGLDEQYAGEFYREIDGRLLAHRGEIDPQVAEELANRLVSQASAWLAVYEVERDLAEP